MRMPPIKRRGTAKPSRLRSVPDPATESAPPDVDTPFPMTPRERSSAAGRVNLAKMRETKRLNQAQATRDRLAGVPTRYQLYCDGKLPLDEWTEAELSHGRPASRDGSFDGPGPKFTPREHQAIRAALLRHGEKLLASYYPGALKVLEEVASYGESEPSRVKAANLLIERIAGRTVEKIEIKSSDPWQDILDEIMEDDVLTRMADSDVASADTNDGER